MAISDNGDKVTLQNYIEKSKHQRFFLFDHVGDNDKNGSGKKSFIIRSEFENKYVSTDDTSYTLFSSINCTIDNTNISYCNDSNNNYVYSRYYYWFQE
jgi:hypothetical protein